MIRALLILLFTALPVLATDALEAAATVVIYNSRSPEATTLAASYAQKRSIPFKNVIGIACSDQESISREEYDNTIARPLKQALVQGGWWKLEPHPMRLGEAHVVHSSLRYAVLIRGIPLRIAPRTEPYPGDFPDRVPSPVNRNEASVDSELALLGMNRGQITGPAENPFHKSGGRAMAAGFPPGMLLVCRLDAASQFTVQRMVDDAFAAEQMGLWGFAYVDSRAVQDGGLKAGDEWLRSVAGASLRAGIPTIHEDSPELFPPHYPMEHAALYFGWYARDAVGPFRRPGFRMVPGAIAVHIHSFSAATLRSPEQNWCAPLLEAGAAATLGNVYEPYLHLTAHLDLFHERLLRGFNFAEAAYAATPALSWMGVVIGDPLYRPFKVRKAGRGTAAEFSAFRQAAQGWFGKKRSAAQANLVKQGNAMKSGVIFEGLATLQLSSRDPKGALESLLIARRYYRHENDQARCALSAAGLMANMRQPKEAVALLREQMKATPHTVAIPLMHQMIDRIIPKPPAPSAPR